MSIRVMGICHVNHSDGYLALSDLQHVSCVAHCQPPLKEAFNLFVVFGSMDM